MTNEQSAALIRKVREAHPEWANRVVAIIVGDPSNPSSTTFSAPLTGGAVNLKEVIDSGDYEFAIFPTEADFADPKVVGPRFTSQSTWDEVIQTSCRIDNPECDSCQ